jgi:hypothetical protein
MVMLGHIIEAIGIQMTGTVARVAIGRVDEHSQAVVNRSNCPPVVGQRLNYADNRQ